MSISDATLLFAHGRGFTSDRFAEILNFKGMHDGASKRSWALRQYGLISINGGNRVLTDLALRIVQSQSLEAILEAAASPTSFREIWKSIETAEFVEIPNEKEFSGAVFNASLKLGLIVDGSWNQDALETAKNARFGKTWIRSIAAARQASLSTNAAADGSIQIPARGSAKRVYHRELGLTLIFDPAIGGEFPEESVEISLPDDSGDIRHFGIESGGWSLLGPNLIREEDSRRALAFFQAARKDVTSA